MWPKILPPRLVLMSASGWNGVGASTPVTTNVAKLLKVQVVWTPLSTLTSIPRLVG